VDCGQSVFIFAVGVDEAPRLCEEQRSVPIVSFKDFASSTATSIGSRLVQRARTIICVMHQVLPMNLWTGILFPAMETCYFVPSRTFRRVKRSFKKTRQVAQVLNFFHRMVHFHQHLRNVYIGSFWCELLATELVSIFSLRLPKLRGLVVVDSDAGVIESLPRQITMVLEIFSEFSSDGLESTVLKQFPSLVRAAVNLVGRRHETGLYASQRAADWMEELEGLDALRVLHFGVESFADDNIYFLVLHVIFAMLPQSLSAFHIHVPDRYETFCDELCEAYPVPDTLAVTITTDSGQFNRGTLAGTRVRMDDNRNAATPAKDIMWPCI